MENKEVIRDNSNRCIYCGEIIPEGIQMCKSCEYEQLYGYHEKNKHTIKKMNKQTREDKIFSHNKKKYSHKNWK